MEDNVIWHDVSGALALHYHFNEFTGLLFEPKVTVQIGDGRSDKDLINVSTRLGFVQGFLTEAACNAERQPTSGRQDVSFS